MRRALVILIVFVGSVGIIAFALRGIIQKSCWCWRGDQHMVAGPRPQMEPNEYVSYGSYGREVDWNNSDRVIPLDYNQDQGKRVFYQQCVWCHADTTPAGPSNRSNVSPDPPLINDGNILNKLDDATLKKMIVAGGSAMGKSAMMPPYGSSLSDEEINDLIAYIRVIAVPEYHITGQNKANSRNKPS